MNMIKPGQITGRKITGARLVCAAFLIFFINTGLIGQGAMEKSVVSPGSGGLATEAGLISKFVYFERSAGINESSLLPLPSFYIGPGAFFDYRFNSVFAVSAEISGVFDVAQKIDKAQSLQAGLFAKYWVNESWGYVGAGAEAFFSKLDIGGTAVDETDVMLTLILTGERVLLKDRFDAVGNLRFGISLYNNLSDKDFRFYFAYTLGFGVNFDKKN